MVCTVNEIILEVRVPFFDWSRFVGRKKNGLIFVHMYTWNILSPISLTDFTVTITCNRSKWGIFLLSRIKIFITLQFPKDIFDWFCRKTKKYLVKLKNEFKRDFDPIVQYRYTSKTFKYVLSPCLIVINDKTDFVKIGWRKCLLNQKRASNC